eukprot:gene9327-10311_t
MTVKTACYSFQCLNVRAQYPLDDTFYNSYIAMIAFDSILGPIAATLNCMVLIVIIKNRCLQTVPNAILFSLATSDMIAGLVIQPLKAVMTYQIINRNVVCGLYITSLQLGYLIGMTSYLSLTLMAFERYFAIFHPFKYYNWTTSKRIIVRPIIAIWLLSILIIALSFSTPQMTIMRLFVITLIPTSIAWSAFVYIRACLLVKRINVQTARITIVTESTKHDENAVADGVALETRCTAKAVEYPSAVGKNSLHREDKGLGKKSKQPPKRKASSIARQGPNSKATRLAVVILVVLVICYIPSCVLTFMRDYSRVKKRWVFGVHDWGTSFVLLNSTLNPIIYCWKLSEMRVKILDFLKSICCAKRQAEITEK